MKNLFFLVLMVLLSAVSQAQIATQWNVAVYDRNWMPPETTGPFWKTHSYKAGEEEILNNVRFRKFFFSRDTSFNPSGTFDTLKTVNNKMYVVIDEIEYLLYDFSMEVGDSVLITRFFDWMDYEVYAKMLSVSDTAINNRVVKKYKVAYLDSTSNYYAYNVDYWIEGIGSEKYGILNESVPINIIGADRDYHLLCYKEDDVTVLQDPNYNTCYKETIFNGVSELKLDGVKLFPTLVTKGNPVTIEAQQPLNTVQVFNALGVLQYTFNDKANPYQLNTADLPFGYYVVVVNGQAHKFLVVE